MVVVTGRQASVDGGQVIDRGAELLVVRPWWYSIGWDFQWFELVQRGQAPMGIIKETGRGEDGKLLSFCHVCRWAGGDGQRERRRRRWRWLGHACIIICPGQDTMHEAALGGESCSVGAALMQMGECQGVVVQRRTEGQECGHCLECGDAGGL